MLIHPWDAPTADSEWQEWLAVHNFGQLTVNGLDGEPPFVQPLHFAYDPRPGTAGPDTAGLGQAGLGEAVTHLARPNPIWRALEARPRVTLSVVDDYTFIPGPWHAPEGGPTEHGTPTSFYAAVLLHCTTHIVDEPQLKADLLQRQVGHFQPQGGTAPVVPGQEPFGRMLPGIRGIRLEVTDVRAKFKYGGNKPEELRRRVMGLLADRAGPHDAAARAHQSRRLTAAADAEARA